MRHEGGLDKVKTRFSAINLRTINIKSNSAGQIIEEEDQQYIDGYRRTFHPVTRDIISNEIFRRVEPNKRTMDDFLKQELPFADVHFSVDEDQLHRCYNKKFWHFFKTLTCSEHLGF